jgi:hypothetical protein
MRRHRTLTLTPPLTLPLTLPPTLTLALALTPTLIFNYNTYKEDKEFHPSLRLWHDGRHSWYD